MNYLRPTIIGLLALAAILAMPSTTAVIAANLPPVANAGPDLVVEVTTPSGSFITLDGTGSADPDGDPLTFAAEPESAATATPSVTPGDANLRKIVGTGSVLSGVELELKTINVVVRLDSGGILPVGVYLDIVPPGGTTNPFGCLPNGRIAQTTITLDSAGVAFPKNQPVFGDTGTLGDDLVEFSCTDHAGAFASGNSLKRYTLIAVADVNADDLASCAVLLSWSCSGALADDDTDDPDNGPVPRTVPKVGAPGTTSLDAASTAGDTQITVDSQTLFAVGNTGRINAGQANQEDFTVTAVNGGILTLASALLSNHADSEPVLRLT